MRIDIQGESLELLPQRAMHWPREGTLFIADPHFGKPETFRAAAVPVPDGSTAGALARLDEALESTGARRLAILGDFWHSRVGKSEALLAELEGWRKSRGSLEIELIPGNHDRGAGGVPAEWDFRIHAGPVFLAPFLLSHHPEASEAGYVLAGHIHPGVTLRGRGRQKLRLPAFWFGPRVAVLPAFGAFTGKAIDDPPADARVFAVAGGEVIETTLPIT